MKGALKLATKPGVPIIPVALNGTYHMLEETGVVSPARVDVRIYPAIPTAGLSRAEEKELSEKIETLIRTGVEELHALQSEELQALPSESV
jgi:1-acyl-sn-glycerol-3-phosphate acyltransferase